MGNDRQTRIEYIDFLKFVGLTGIIVAHVGSPGWVMMFRSFDVPLMIILSSILGEKSYRKYIGKGCLSLKNYFVSRFKRLVIPTWIFLTIYFVLLFLASGEHYSLYYYVASFCLTRYGISYVWIILIYMYSALLIPMFSKIKPSPQGIVIVGIIYCLYEMAYYFRIGTENIFLDTTLFYIVPYGMLAYLGYNYYQISRKVRLIIAVIALLIFGLFGIYYWAECGSPQLVQIAKYPPRLYYLSYGVAWSFFLLLLCERKKLKLYKNVLIQYISKHSLWIYLWHILVLTIYEILHLPEVWYVKLVIVYVAAISIVVVVNKVLDWIEKRKIFKALHYLRG